MLNKRLKETNMDTILNTDIITTRQGDKIKIAKVQTIKKEYTNLIKYKGQIETGKPFIFNTKLALDQFLIDNFYMEDEK
jgi:hypothetical protein